MLLRSARIGNVMGSALRDVYVKRHLMSLY